MDQSVSFLSEGLLRSWSPGLNLKSLLVNDNTSTIDSVIL